MDLFCLLIRTVWLNIKWSEVFENDQKPLDSDFLVLWFHLELNEIVWALVMQICSRKSSIVFCCHYLKIVGTHESWKTIIHKLYTLKNCFVKLLFKKKKHSKFQDTLTTFLWLPNLNFFLFSKSRWFCSSSRYNVKFKTKQKKYIFYKNQN